VDGVINEDRLGLDRIFVQAKRYAPENSIGRPDVQAFVGSLLGQHASESLSLLRTEQDGMETFVGFDSAWADNPKAPGAIAAVCLDDQERCTIHPPRLASFDQALAFIDDLSDPAGLSLVALDQPTIVPNAMGMRPVERAAASLISWLAAVSNQRTPAGSACSAPTHLFGGSYRRLEPWKTPKQPAWRATASS
jgi:hypothetical protein